MRRYLWRTWLVLSLIGLPAAVILWPASHGLAPWEGISVGQYTQMTQPARVPTGIGSFTAHKGALIWEHVSRREIDRILDWRDDVGWGDGHFRPDLPPIDPQNAAANAKWSASAAFAPLADFWNDDWRNFKKPPRPLGFSFSHESRFTDHYRGNLGSQNQQRPYRVTLLTYRTFSVPFWLLVMLFAPAPVIALRRRYRQRGWRGHDGQAVPCPKCGYDLRGRPEVSNCPECGTAVADGTAP